MLRHFAIASLFTLAAGIIGLGVTAAAAQQGDACGAAMSCDCAGINAGVLSGQWRRDCNACEAKILEQCRRSYARHGDMERALIEAGFCRRDCSVFGDGAFPNAPASRKEKGKTAGDPGPSDPARFELLCSFEKPPAAERIGGLEFSGCKNKQGRRSGLWKAYDAARRVVIEVLYRDGREVSRRERPVG